jgi:hypothetical protein
MIALLAELGWLTILVLVGIIAGVRSVVPDEKDFRSDQTMPFVGLSSVLAVLLVLQFFGGFPIFQTIKQHPWSVLVYLAAYALIGTIWMFFRWYLFLRKMLLAYKAEARHRVCVTHGVDEDQIPEGFWTAEILEEHDTLVQKAIFSKPTVNRFSNELFTWFALWPFSIVQVLLHAFTVDFFKMVLSSWSKTLQAVADSMFGPYLKK